MSRPERPADDGATVWLDFNTPPPEASAEAVNQIVEQGATLVGRYKLLEKIGEGNLSRVYKAVDLREAEAGSGDPYVAVRVLKEPLAKGNDAIELLSQQIQALQSVTHPNIVHVIDCGRDADTAFITMELLAGNSLQQKINAMKSRGMARKEAFPIILAMARALEFAHARNVVHGDLKPEDVIIADTGEVKVMDFGFARRSAIESAKNLTSAYASAEVLQGGRPDPRDDVFALACISWRLLTGEHPFRDGGAAAARDAGLQLTCPSQLTAREFTALRRGLEFERSKRTLSVHNFESEFLGSGGGGTSGTLRTAGIALVILLALLAAGLFAYHTLPTSHTVAALAPQADSAPSELAPGTAFRDCQGCPLMKVMAPGSFLQGAAADDPEAQPFEKPQHRVSIAYAFAAGVFEVTVGQFAQYVTETGADIHGCAVYDGDWHSSADISWKNATDGQTASYPVSCVSWQDAKRYATWLSQRTHQLYRLPSASEWEYAARAGSTAQPWSDASQACSYANLGDQTAAARFPGWVALPCADKFVQSAPVGSFEANAFGLYDTLGNASEWVDDCWADDYTAAPSDGSARTDADCNQRELRGGSWFTKPDSARASYRERFPASYRSTNVGFRLIREISR